MSVLEVMMSISYIMGHVFYSPMRRDFFTGSEINILASTHLDGCKMEDVLGKLGVELQRQG